jgi:Ca-activated chloride channel family protein
MILAACTLASSITWAMGGPARPIGPDGSGLTIQKGDDAAKILRSLSANPTGKPIRLNKSRKRRLAQVFTEPGEIPRLKVEIDGKKLDLPLKHTNVRAELTGYVGSVEVTQTYHNPFEYPIEAIYIFPLPENSAVDNMKMIIGERIIEADIQKREEARKTYNQAKARGNTAALLEQERPNIFTQSVANIAPGENIDVVIHYLQTLTYDAGQYEFVFPMVVGPRFFPGQATGSKSGSGWAKDTTRVPDASRISPPVLGRGYRSGHDISIEVVADAGIPIKNFDVPTHTITEHPSRKGALHLELAKDDSIPNRDFVLRYSVRGEAPEASFLDYQDDRGGFFTMVVHPPHLDVDKLVGKRELIFVVDISGSMRGVPLSMCQDAMEEALRNVRPVDTFNIITFAGRTGQAFNKARPANNTNIKLGLDFVRGMRAGGGTQMLKGVQAALSPEVERGRHRYVFFLTDGYIGNEKEIFAGTTKLIERLKSRGQRAKVFGFGVGSSVNRHLLNGIGKAGQGLTVFATTREDPAKAVNKFYRYIDHSVLSDVEIDWGDLQVEQTYPTVIPDLFASRPIIVHGRYTGSGSSTVRIKGMQNGHTMELPVEVNVGSTTVGNNAHATLWARAKIDDLERHMWHGRDRSVIEQITELGLGFKIVTAYTSLVAVDKSRTVDGDLKTIVQPVEAPEGVDAKAAGAPAFSQGMLSGKIGVGSYGRAKVKTGNRAYAKGGGSSVYGGGLKASRSPRKRYSKRPAREMVSQAPMADTAESSSSEMEDASLFNSGTRSADKEKKSKPISRRDSLVRTQNLIVMGGLNKDQVSRVLKTHQVQLHRCVERENSERVQVRWFISASGIVLQVKVVGSLSTQAKNCLTSQLRKLRFPASRDGSPVEVRMTLSAMR